MGQKSCGQWSCALGQLLMGIVLLGCSSQKPAQNPQGASGGDEASPQPASGSTTSQIDGDAKPKGALPPDFELETLNGDVMRLGDYLGKEVVLLDFWATYCDPCLAAMPHLDDLYRKYKDKGFLVMGISIDGPQSVAQVRTEVARMGVSFPILLDDESSVVALYNPRTSAPYSVLIARDGSVLARREGYTTASGEQLETDIKQALGQP